MKDLNLSTEQAEGALKLTKDFLPTLQTASQELSKILTESNITDPIINQKITIIQKEFGIKLETYNLDLSDLIGDEKALKVSNALHSIIPQILLQGSEIAAGNHSGHNGADMSNMTNMPNMSAQDNSKQQTANTTQSANNTQGMNNMSGANTMPSMNQNNLELVNHQILIQIQSYNAMLMQMLATINKQNNNGNLQAALQPIYQMITNQSYLIQMLYSNLNNSATNTNNGSNSNNGMGSMGMMGK
jgi:hypothetical protein